jgi:hypothetical protein
VAVEGTNSEVTPAELSQWCGVRETETARATYECVRCDDESVASVLNENVSVACIDVSYENVCCLDSSDVNNQSKNGHGICQSSVSVSSVLCSDEMPASLNKRPFSFLVWNINGLLSKIKDSSFVSFVCEFDFICLVETFVESFDSSLFAGYSIFCKPAFKLSKQGRRSGGVVCFVKDTFLPFIKLIDVNCPNCFVFMFDKKLFGLTKDVLYICAYVPPEGSPFYTYFDLDNGIHLLEEGLIDCLLEKDAYVILCGDLNSRTSNISQDYFSNSVLDTQYKSQSLNSDRRSEDRVLNNYGKLLLSMCTTLGMNILNGVCKGDLDGGYTYICGTGSSVTDYFIFSSELFSIVYQSCELYISERIESDHLPVSLRVFFPNENVLKVDKVMTTKTIEKFAWNSENAQMFSDALYSGTNCNIFETAIQLIDEDIDSALTMFNECIRMCAEYMKKRVNVNNVEKSNDWFDQECKVSRTNVTRLLRKYRNSLDDGIRNEFIKVRREYKYLLKRKEKQFNDFLLDKLESSIQNQKEFWDTIHKASLKRKQPRNNISIDTWFCHFKTLLEKGSADEN